MACYHPITLKSGQVVPCGHCEGCAKDMQNAYTIRTSFEAKKWSNGWFITLTFRPSAVPHHHGWYADFSTGELLDENEHTFYDIDNHCITAWKKRFRRYYEYHYGYVPKFSFLICGEYGPKTHRPHYHGIIFGLSRKEFYTLMYGWKQYYGFYKVSALKFNKLHEASRYVAKYMCKSDNFQDVNVLSGECPRPRKLVSPNYGYDKDLEVFKTMDRFYNCLDILTPDDLPTTQDLWHIVARAADRLYMPYNGYNYKLPRYYVYKFYYEKDSFGKKRKNELRRLVTLYLRVRFEIDVAKRSQDYYLQESDLPPCNVDYIDYLPYVLEDIRLSQLEEESALARTSKKFYARSQF